VSAEDQPTVLDGLALDDGPQLAWRLKPRLREISGLAMSPDQRLFAVDDERARIYEIDYAEGRINKVFDIGRPALRGDFEGLAIVGTTFYLMTSNGRIIVAEEGADGEHVASESFDTGLAKQCEFEGLAVDPQSAGLLLLCKNVLGKADIDSLSIFAWDIQQRRVDESQRIVLPMDAIRARLGIDRLRPSGLAVHPRQPVMVIVAARERALVELDFTGELRNAIILPNRKAHPQAEGIEFGVDQQLIIADEGGKGRARLSLYSNLE
jgi:uncharacterized protein YjiK